VSGPVLDQAAQLHSLARSVAQPDDLAERVSRALQALGRVIDFDLAAAYRLDGHAARIIAAVGPLAHRDVRTHVLDIREHGAIRRALETRQPVPLLEHDHRGPDGDPYDPVLGLPPGHGCMVVPLFAGQDDLGVITLDRATCRPFSAETLELAGVYGQLISLAVHFSSQAQHLRRVEQQLRAEKRLLKSELGHDRAVALLSASPSPSMRAVLRLAEQVAPTELPVLILGETGTGKEVLAQALHALSGRAGRPLVTLNCSAVPEQLVESELFGHVKGAFSGAARARPGRFVTANHGTLLLDEIGDMPLSAQAKLLRVLQEGTLEPVGSDRTVRVDVRVVAATHVDLRAAVEDGRFREDLYYRLAVFPLQIPALRDRAGCPEALALSFLAETHARTGRGPWTLSRESIAVLAQAEWPGNVRELRNALDRATILQPLGEIRPEHLPPDLIPELATETGKGGVQAKLSWRENERRYLMALMASTNGRIHGPEGAAARAELKPSTLRSKLVRNGLR